MTWLECKGMPGVYVGIPPQTVQAHAWRYFTPGTSEAEARETFAQREAAQPEVVGVNQFWQVLAGPVADGRI
jgi:hypothetical protein